MGSYAECWLGPFYVGSTKNNIDPNLMRLFRADDKRSLQPTKTELPAAAGRWAEEADESDPFEVVLYRTSYAIAKDRLELAGYTMVCAREAFELCVAAELESFSERLSGEHGHLFADHVAALRSLSVDSWLAGLLEIKLRGLKPKSRRVGPVEPADGLIGYMLHNDWYGYPGPDPNIALRLALEVCDGADELVYDVTDLVLSGDFDSAEDLVQYASSMVTTEFASTAKTVVLMEGRTDGRVLAESLQVLYPHLRDYFTFMDFDGARFGGGAGNLVNMVKAFAGAGIVNRVIAVFDNDTAAEAALRGLRDVRLPPNIRLLRLPELELLRRYPTIGPSGVTVMDVNGLAGSLELYCGVDVLADGTNGQTPLQWTGFEPSVGRYQGEVLEKAAIQERFFRRLERCRADVEEIQRTDWDGIRAILLSLFTQFSDQDHRDICHGLADYYGR